MSPSRRAQQAVTAHRLRTEGEGLGLAAIAREMGISVSYASSLLTDPTGEHDRQRKRKYLKRCKKCGALCYGDHCKEHTVNNKRTKWTRGLVIEAIQEWEIEHGHPPTCPEWSRRTGLAEWAPTVGIVYRIFGKGGWNKAIEAAGFTPRPAHAPEWAQSTAANEPHPMGPEARERLSAERKALYAENPDHPMFSGLKEGWDMSLVRQERKDRRFLAKQAARHKN